MSNRELKISIEDKKGKGYQKVYRAVPNDVNDFKHKDFVTLSLKFAVEHAENNHIVYDEPHKVIVAKISNSEIFEATNPGEYLYGGQPVNGKTVYETKGYEYEGWDELSKEDFNESKKMMKSVKKLLRESLLKEYFNTTIDPEIKKHSNKFVGRGVTWFGDPDQMIVIHKDNVHGMWGNEYDTDKFNHVVEMINNAEDNVEFECSYGIGGITTIIDVIEEQTSYHGGSFSVDYENLDEPSSTGDEELDRYLGTEDLSDFEDIAYHIEESDVFEMINDHKTQVAKGRISPEQIISMLKSIPDATESDAEGVKEFLRYEAMVKEAIDNKWGDLGEFTVQLRDGHHRVMGAIKAGEKYVCLNLDKDSIKEFEGHYKRVTQPAMVESLNEEMTGGFRAFHGSINKIEKFSDEFVGGKDANDQNGPGIYFTSTYDEAKYYTSSESGYIYSVKLDSGKYLDSEERSDQYLYQYKADLLKLVKMAPEWEMNAYDWAQDPETGAEVMVNSAIEYNSSEKDVFLQIWIEVYRHKEVHFVRNMSKLGYSGIFVPADKANNNGNHIIVFNPATVTVEDVEVIGSETNETITEIDKFPISDPPMYGDSNYKSRNGKIIQMKPQDYLSLVPHLELDDASEENIEDLAGMMEQGVEIDPPTLYLDGTQVDNHDGRHRVYAAMRLGLKMVPVLMLDINGNEPQLKGLKKTTGVNYHFH